MFEIIEDHGGAKDPTECLWSYKNKYDVPQRQITEMLMMQKEKKGERVAKSPAVFITDEQRKYMQSQVRSSRAKSLSKSPTRSRSPRPAPTDPRPPRRGRTPVKKEEKEEDVKDDGYGPSTSDFVAAVACSIIDSRQDLAKEVLAACDAVAPEREPSQSRHYSGPNPRTPAEGDWPRHSSSEEQSEDLRSSVERNDPPKKPADKE